MVACFGWGVQGGVSNRPAAWGRWRDVDSRFRGNDVDPGVRRMRGGVGGMDSRVGGNDVDRVRE